MAWILPLCGRTGERSGTREKRRPLRAWSTLSGRCPRPHSRVIPTPAVSSLTTIFLASLKNHTLTKRAAGVARRMTTRSSRKGTAISYASGLGMIGSKYVRVYDAPQTPYARALAHRKIPKLQKEKLRTQHATLNPVTLLKEIATLKEALSDVN